MRNGSDQPIVWLLLLDLIFPHDGCGLTEAGDRTEKVITSVHEATEKDVDVAVAAARKAFEGEWRKVTPEDRGRLLHRLADLIDQHFDTLVAIESLDNGKALNSAKWDIQGSARCLRYFGGWADKVEGKVIDTGAGTFNYTRQEPVSREGFNGHGERTTRPFGSSS